MTVSMNAIIIDKTQLSANDIGDYNVILLLKNKEKTVEYPIEF